MAATWLGVSLKMYFAHARTRAWVSQVRDLALADRGIQQGTTELVVLPSFVALVPALDALQGSGVLVGAQDLATEDAGAYTGEVSGAELAEIGARYAEVGHLERRTLFGEDEVTVRAKAAAALRHGLTPVLCVGEREQVSPAEAARTCVRQVRAALWQTGAGDGRAPVVVAYEPCWAIGKEQPADPGYVAAVVVALRAELERSGPPPRVVYGGSAGPGLLTRLGHAVDGLFLGRFAHDPEALRGILGEAAELAQTTR